MTVNMIDGPGGLEYTHVYSPGDGSAAITMNNTGPLFPRIKFDRMAGFRSLPDADDNRQARTARIGETVLPGQARGKTFTVDGIMQARGMTDLRGLERQMLAAFGERDLEGTWSAIPLAAWDPTNGGTNYWQSTCRVLAYDPDTDFSRGVSAVPSPYQLGFQLSVRMSDPRWSWTAQVVSAANAGQVTVTNLGNAPAEPVVTVATPGTTVVVTNTTTGKKLRFTGMSGVGGSLVIDFAKRTALTGAVDAIPFLDSLASDWWDRGVPGLKTGANTVTQTGGGSVQVTFKHASW